MSRARKLPDRVGADEVEREVLKMLVDKFDGRSLEIGVVDLGLSLALASLRALHNQQNRKKP